jgi:hypothetical protein
MIPISSAKPLPEDVVDGQVFKSVPLRGEPLSATYQGKRGLVFFECHLGDAAMPSDAVIVNCIGKHNKNNSTDVIDSKNYCAEDVDALDIPQGAKFIACNFSRKMAGTRIFAGRTDLVFIGCNLKNCVLDVPPENIIDCNTHQKDIEKEALPLEGKI